ncbi:hypothetical protein SEA_ATUIN_286 [Arthrobacter phage Atuin]|nr:hypothetical protein SEA_ATUIN_85 [Arthrobacter phage Atuin]
MTYSITIYSHPEGALLEKSEQEEAPDIEALCKKHELGFWKRAQRVERFSMTIYYCYHGRIHVKHIKEEERT